MFATANLVQERRTQSITEGTGRPHNTDCRSALFPLKNPDHFTTSDPAQAVHATRGEKSVSLEGPRLEKRATPEQ